MAAVTGLDNRRSLEDTSHDSECQYWNQIPCSLSCSSTTFPICFKRGSIRCHNYNIIWMSIPNLLIYLIEMFILPVTQTKNTICELLKPRIPIFSLKIESRHFNISAKIKVEIQPDCDLIICFHGWFTVNLPTSANHL